MRGAVIAAALGLISQACAPPGSRWVAFYDPSGGVDIDRLGRDFDVVVIDADPTLDRWTDQALASLLAANDGHVLAYLSLGSCERSRDYWSNAPAPLVPCGQNTAAHLGPYEGYPDEVWVNPSNGEYQRLIVEHVALRLLARGVDGLFLDNFDVTERSDASVAACDGSCAQGALDLVARLRERFPEAWLVTNNGTSDVARLGATGGQPFPRLIDGVSHEGTFRPVRDERVLAELRRWSGEPSFFVGTLDDVVSCDSADGRAVCASSWREGFWCATADLVEGVGGVCWRP